MKLNGTENENLRADMTAYGSSFAVKGDDKYVETVSDNDADGPERCNVVDLLVSWHIQEYVLPLLKDDVILFDPLDENQIDLSGLPNT